MFINLIYYRLLSNIQFHDIKRSSKDINAEDVIKVKKATNEGAIICKEALLRSTDIASAIELILTERSKII